MIEGDGANDRALAHGWALSGGKPSSVQVMLDGAAIDPELKAGMTTHGENLYVFQA